METKISVIGGGSWATALVKILTANIDQVCWYMRNEQAIEHIKATKHNPNYLSDVHLNINKLHLTNDINEAVAFSDYIVFSIPSAFLSDELEKSPNHYLIKIFFLLSKVLNLKADSS